MLNRLFKLVDSAFALFERLLYIAFALAGLVGGWIVLGAFEVDGVMRVAGALGAGLATFIIGWIVWNVMKFVGDVF